MRQHLLTCAYDRWYCTIQRWYSGVWQDQEVEEDRDVKSFDLLKRHGVVRYALLSSLTV